jgi:hypothetical protein
MSRISKVGIVALTLGVLALASCTLQPVRLGPESPTEYDASRGWPITGQACGFMLGGFIPINMSDRDQRALSLLREQADRDYIAGVSVEQSLTYAFVGWTVCSTFHATAYPRR